jgi:hypothetical protein
MRRRIRFLLLLTMDAASNLDDSVEASYKLRSVIKRRRSPTEARS